MAQLIYAISALAIAVVFAVSMQTTTNVGQGSVYQNEVLTQIVAIGRDIVDDIARQELPFDEQVDPDRIPQPATYPYVHTPEGLTPEGGFGSADCRQSNVCLDIDDYHNPNDPVAGEQNGLTYSATITVRYVDEENPIEDAPLETGGMSFAKEIAVNVSTDAIILNGEPMSATYRRVITYPRITNYAY